MTDNIEKKVAVDGPVANEGEHGSSPFFPSQVSPADPLGFGQRWTVARKREVVLRLLRGEPMELMSRQFGVARHDVTQARRLRQTCVQGTGCDTELTVSDVIIAVKLYRFVFCRSPAERKRCNL